MSERIPREAHVASKAKNPRNRMKYLRFLLLFFSLNAIGQNASGVKLIKEKGDYFFKSANTSFPIVIDNFSRKNIHSFNKKNNNIGAEYRNSDSGHSTKISINIYPAESGFEGRLRDEYLASLRSIAEYSNSEIQASQTAVKKWAKNTSVMDLRQRLFQTQILKIV
jgi:hypothetical protein